MKRDPQLRRTIARARTNRGGSIAPASPTFGMRWWDPNDGLTRVYTSPGVWQIVSGGAAEWDKVTGKPSTFPPDAHQHNSTTDISNWPVGSWTIQGGIIDPAVVTTLNDLKTLLQSSGIIN